MDMLIPKDVVGPMAYGLKLKLELSRGYGQRIVEQPSSPF